MATMINTAAISSRLVGAPGGRGGSGAAAIAAIICMGPLVVALGVMVAITWPELAVVPLVVVLGVGALVLPVALYPSSYTVWQAIDIVMRPVTPGDFDVDVVAGGSRRAGPDRGVSTGSDGRRTRRDD